jgi:hypothetical protein
MNATGNGASEIVSPTTPNSESIGPNASPQAIPFAVAVDLRDYFAAAALTGLSALNETYNQPFEKIASMAWKQADAMIAARDSEPDAVSAALRGAK